MSITPWPFERERANPTVRARRIAQMYRVALGEINPELRDQLDVTAEKYGESWVLNRAASYDDNDMVTARIAAEILCVSHVTVHRYYEEGILPGVKEDKIIKFRVGDLRALPARRLGRPPKGR